MRWCVTAGNEWGGPGSISSDEGGSLTESGPWPPCKAGLRGSVALLYPPDTPLPAWLSASLGASLGAGGGGRDEGSKGCMRPSSVISTACSLPPVDETSKSPRSSCV